MFERRNVLKDGEYRRNFLMVDYDVMTVLDSPEARGIYKSMIAVYLRFRNAAGREGVLKIEATEQGAWKQLVQLSGVSSGTLAKVIPYMHEKAVIGYSVVSGVGIQIFFNIATASIGERSIPKNESVVPTIGTPYKEEFPKGNSDISISAVAVFTKLQAEIEALKAEAKKTKSEIRSYPARVEEYFLKFGIPKATRVVVSEMLKSKPATRGVSPDIGASQPTYVPNNIRPIMDEALAQMPVEIASLVMDSTNPDQLAIADEALRQMLWDAADEGRRVECVVAAQKELKGSRLIGNETEVLKRAQIELVRLNGYPRLGQLYFIHS